MLSSRSIVQTLSTMTSGAQSGVPEPELLSGRAQYRVLIARGNVFARFDVIRQLATDGAIELRTRHRVLSADL